MDDAARPSREAASFACRVEIEFWKKKPRSDAKRELLRIEFAMNTTTSTPTVRTRSTEATCCLKIYACYYHRVRDALGVSCDEWVNKAGCRSIDELRSRWVEVEFIFHFFTWPTDHNIFLRISFITRVIWSRINLTNVIINVFLKLILYIEY